MASKPRSPGGKSPAGKKGKSRGSSKGAIKQALASKIEELVRTSELDMALQRENLGLAPKGDMSDFIRDLTKKLKSRKR